MKRTKSGRTTTTKAAQILGMSPAALQVRRSRGNGPTFVRKGRSVFYKQADLIKWKKSSPRVNNGERTRIEKLKKAAAQLRRIATTLRKLSVTHRRKKAK